MATCKKIRRISKRVCIGSLSRKIIINTRSIIAPAGGDVDFNEALTEQRTVWANIVTVKGEEIFDETNTVQNISHDVYIRYFLNMTPEKWVKLSSINSGKDDYLNIKQVVNLNEENRFYLLRCNLRGSFDKPVNLSNI